MTLKRLVIVLGLAGLALSLVAFAPLGITALRPVASRFFARASGCTPVGGALMTNIGAIAGETNLGPVFGDLQGSVAATILGENHDGSFNVQHYWVTAAGDSIYLAQGVLHPTYPTSDMGIVAVPWGNYTTAITGGTGKFKNATGSLEYFGMADFHQNTLVIRYRGEVCYAAP